METTQKPNWMVPISIIVAGALIAGAVIYVKGGNKSQIAGVAEGIQDHPEENMLPVTADDHILGNPNAPIKLVEYSDTDCPYCQNFQKTLNQVMDEYGKDGKVAWVYRHFAFHPKAPKEAEAAECVAEIGGNAKFFEYIDLLFSKKNFTQSPYVGLDPKELPVLAGSIGVDKVAVNSCLESGRYKKKIEDQYQQAIDAGAQGTPHTIIVTKNGKVPITKGAVPYETLKSAIQSLLNEDPS
jgi:protein-disulfide isomerase